MIKISSKHVLIKIFIVFIITILVLPFIIMAILQPPLKEQKNTPSFAYDKLYVTYSAIKKYSKDYKEYPSPEKWCDLILPYLGRNRKYILTSTKNRIAINPNAKPDSPDDVVLLFESTGGWNAHGQAELLASSSGGKMGCYIFFNNGEFKFILPNQAQELNWGNNP